MKKILLYLFLLLILTSCSKVETSVDSDIESPKNIEIIDSNDEENIIEEAKPVPMQVPEGKVISPLTGLYIDEEEIKDRPIAVMLDNYYKARPQAGLSEADIVYEILAEGGITRYLAIFSNGKPETVGPVRSARPYFIYKALEFNPLYVHVGGSPQAFIDLHDLKVADIDALSSGGNVFWRKKHKPIPNNMYTSLDAIRKEANRKGYSLNSNFTPIKFNELDKDINGEELINIKFPYHENYISEFRYDNNEKLYHRYVNNKPHKDETTNINLQAKNIIIQYTNNRVIDNEGRLEIEIIGEGKGYYITNGQIIDIIWKKPEIRSQTKIYDTEGNEIKLNPGITWYQIIPSNMKIIMN